MHLTAQPRCCWVLGRSSPGSTPSSNVPESARAGDVGRRETPTADVTIVSAGETDVERLARLDDDLRQEVPGSDGWANDLETFRAYTFDARHAAPGWTPRRGQWPASVCRVDPRLPRSTWE